MIRQLMEVSPIRKTLTAPRGIVNGVALDNNSFPALPLPSPALLLQAEQEDESRRCEEVEEVEEEWQHPSASSKSARRLLTLSWTATSKKLLGKVIILWRWGSSTNKFRPAGQGNWRAR